MGSAKLSKEERVCLVFVNRFFYPDHSATSQLLTDLAFKCVEWGFEVLVLTSRQCYDDPSIYMPQNEIRCGVVINRVTTTHFGRKSSIGRIADYCSFVFAVRRRLRKIVDGRTIVVAKTDPPLLGALLLPTVRQRKGRLVNWVQDLFPETLSALNSNGILRWGCKLSRRFRNKCFEQSLVSVVIGRGMRNYLITEGVTEEKLKVIRNWPYESPLGKDVPSKIVRGKEMGMWFMKEVFVVGYFGNLGRVHEIETIVGAMECLRGEHNIRFVFVGGGVFLEQLKARAGELDLRNFEHRDYVPREDLPAALKAVDAHLVVLNPALERFVVPSKFAGVVAAGRPVLYVGDPDGELGRTIGEQRCGYVVRAGDSEDLARRIRDLSRNPDTLRRMGASAARLYQAQYRRDLLLEQWRELLTGLGENTA